MKNKNILYIFLHIPKCGGTTFAYHLKYNFRKHETLSLYKGHGFFNLNTGRHEILKDARDIDSYLKSLTDEQKNKIKIIYGHAVYYGIHKFFNKTPRYITFIREPFARGISAYNHLRKTAGLPNKKVFDGIGELLFMPEIGNARVNIMRDGKFLSFENCIKNKLYNPDSITRFLAERKFIKKSSAYRKDFSELKKKFYLIGTTKNLDRDSLFLYSEIGINRFFTNRNISKNYVRLSRNKKIELMDDFLKYNNIDKHLYRYVLSLNKKFAGQKKVRFIKFKRFFILPFTTMILFASLLIKKFYQKIR